MRPQIISAGTKINNIFMIKKLIFLLYFATSPLFSEVNLLKNGNFENGFEDIGFAYASIRTAHAKIEDGEHGKHLTYYLPAKSTIALNFSEVYVGTEGIYEVSFWAKSSKPAKFKLSGMANGLYSVYFRHLTDFNITSEWQKYTYSFNLKDHRIKEKGKIKGFAEWLPLRFEKIEEVATNIYIADAKLVCKSEDNIVEPISAKLDVQNSAKKSVRIFNKNAKIKISAKIKNTGVDLREQPVTFELVNADRKVIKKLYRTIFIPNGNSELSLRTRTPKLNGTYTIILKVGEKKIGDFDFAVTPKVRAPKGSLPIDIGYNGLLSNCQYDAPTEYEIKFLADSGIAYLRSWDPAPFAWKSVEPEENKYCFNITDKYVEYSLKHGLEVLPVLGGMFFEYPAKVKNHPHMQADWLRKKSEIVPTIKCFQERGRKALKFQMQDWERMITTIATRYKGKIKQYEIMNEPNSIWQDFTTYLPYLKRANEILKSIDQENRVIGFSTSSDYGADINGFLATLLPMGAGKYSDAVSFHSYASLFEDSPKPADKLIDNFKTFLKRNEVVQPLWHSELYYLNPESRLGGGDHKNGPVFHAGYLIRRYVLDSANGIEASILLTAGQVCKKIKPVKCTNFAKNGGHLPNVCNGGDIYIPNEKYIASAVFAQKLQNTDFVKKHVLKDKMLCYEYKSRNSDKCVGIIFALNAYMQNLTQDKNYPKTKVIDPINRTKKNLGKLPEGTLVSDYLGNRVSSSSNEFVLPITPIPIYITTNTSEVLQKILVKLK